MHLKLIGLICLLRCLQIAAISGDNDGEEFYKEYLRSRLVLRNLKIARKGGNITQQTEVLRQFSEYDDSPPFHTLRVPNEKYFASSIEDDAVTQNRASDPRDHTAAGDIQEVNQKEKPRKDIGRTYESFDPELYMADQLFEGCLLLDKKDRELLSHASDLRKEDKKTHISYKDKMWSSNVIPYDVSFTGTRRSNREKFEEVVFAALKSVQSKTCVRFRRKMSSDKNWIEFYSGSGCYAELGRKYWGTLATYISLDVDCWKTDIALHMLMHALGFFHEQNRYDRDDYIKVNWKNVLDGKSLIFHRHDLYNTDMYNSEYDFKSIMHFPRVSFSRRKDLFTLEAKHNRNKVLGGADLSLLDIHKLKKMFCKDEKVKPVQPDVISQWGEWSACSRTCGLGQRFRKQICKEDDCKNARLEMKACRIEKCLASHLDTNFDSNDGIWIIPETYPLACEWARVKATDALKDHTTGSGRFLSVDTSNRNCDKGQPAFLISKIIEKNKYQKCVDFFYIMSGNDVGDLQLQVIYKSGNSMLIWERTGDQGREWKQGAATLPITDEKYRLKFSFRVGGSRTAKIQLDDVFLDDGPCIEGIQRCVDLNHNCGGWADMGECFRNPAYMMRKCCKACSELKCKDKSSTCEVDVASVNGVCTPELWVKCCSKCEDCLDKHPLCKGWADKGECQKNPSWMKLNCKNSCKVCTLKER